MSVLIKHPALRQRLFRLVVHLQLAACDNGGRRIKEEVIRLSGHRAGDGVGAEHGKAAVRRHHDGLAVRAAEADKPFTASHLRVIACDAVMVGIADGDDANAALLCLFNGERHGLVTDKLAHTVMSVDHGGDRRFKDHLWLGVDMDHTLFDALVITYHTLHTVTLDAIKVARKQDVLNNVGFCFGETELFKRLHAERMERFIFPMLIAHNTKILSFILRKVIHGDFDSSCW